jgi:hypothetical protein
VRSWLTIVFSLLSRLIGVLRAPRTTFHAVARSPRWVGALVFTFLLTTGASAAVLETEVGRLALLDQWERVSATFGFEVDDRQYAILQAESRRGTFYAILSALALGPFLSVSLSGLLRAAIRRSGSSEVTFQQVLAVVSHASVILAVRQLVIAPLAYVRETLGSPLTLRPFVSSLEEGSVLSAIAGAIDLFVVWWIIVVAVGISVLSRRPTTPVAALLLASYAGLAAGLGLVVAFTGGGA